ncbi:unnamed protein product, partial [Staurois parvus]
MTRDCGHSTGDDQRLRTQYRRWETADTVQERVRDQQRGALTDTDAVTQR